MQYELIDTAIKYDPLSIDLLITLEDWETFDEEPPCYIAELDFSAHLHDEQPNINADNPDDFYGYVKCDVKLVDVSYYEAVMDESGQLVDRETGGMMKGDKLSFEENNVEDVIVNLNLTELIKQVRIDFEVFAEIHGIGEYTVAGDFV